MTAASVPALARSNYVRSSLGGRTWTEGEVHLMIDMHWLGGCGAATIANRLARTECDVEERIAHIKRGVRQGA